MKKTFFSAYLPSFVAIVAVAALAFALDYQTRALKRQDLRADIEAEVEILRTRLESQIESGIFITRGLASLISRESEVTQAEFSTFARDVTEGRDEVINIAWAPDLIITRVHPIEGNEKAIGVDYRNVPSQLDAVLRARDTGQIALVGPINLVQGGKGFILRVPVYSAVGDSFEFRGILSTVFDLTMFLERAGIMAEDLSIESAISLVSGPQNPDLVFYGDQDLVADTPIMTEVHFPGGSWHLFARPMGGWAGAGQDLLKERLLLLLIALFILGPLIMANRLALARQRTIRDMEIADDRLKAFVRNSPGVFFTYVTVEGKKDRIEFITDACRDIWEAEPVDIYQHPGIIWKSFDEQEVANFLAEVERSRTTMKPWNFSWKSTLKNGNVKWLDGWGHPSTSQDGVTRWDCFVVDNTDQRRRDEEYMRQAEIARQAQKQESIGQLTGGVAHDFNNMLAVIRGNMEMLHDDLMAEGVENDGRLEFVESAITASERGSDLTKKMLSFARRARLVPEDLDLNEIVRELEAWTSRTLPANIEISNELSTGMPFVHVDRSSTASALLNLIVNARDAMPDGGSLKIRTWQTKLTSSQAATMSKELAPGDFVVLSVSDSGHGISKDKLGQIFEPFYTTKGPGSGSGLGLSMVQGFIAQSGGAIQVESTPGNGTSFHLYFRAVANSARPVEIAPETTENLTSDCLRLLVAEDEKEVRKVLVRSLERLGHRVESAASGDAALALFKSKPHFDLLITDVVMPGHLQGVDLAREIRKIRPGFPVVFLSGYNALPMDEGSGLLPEDVRLTKPVSRKELVAAMEKTLGKTLLKVS